MPFEPDIVPSTIAGHAFTLQDRASDILSLRIALDGSSLVALARALAKLEGVRVTDRPEGAGHARCYLIHCLGFQMILSPSAGQAADFALAVVSRTPQAALAVVSELGDMLGRLMSVPPRLAESEPAPRRHGTRTSSGLRRSGLQQGRPLARKTQLRRRTPLARGPFKKR